MAFVQHRDWKMAFHHVIPLRKQTKDSSHTPSPSLSTSHSPVTDSAATTYKRTTATGSTFTPSQCHPPTVSCAGEVCQGESLRSVSPASQVDLDPVDTSAQTAIYT